MNLRKRAIRAVAVLVLGLAFCFVMYWWQLRYEYAAHGIGLNFVAAIPFIGLSVIALGMSRVATALGFAVLALLTGGAYVGAATSSSSTAALIWMAPFLYGTIALAIIFLLDRLFRTGKTTLRVWKDWRSDDRRF